MTPIGYLNGDWAAPEALRISPLDRGFLFADGVYEVICAFDGTPFALAPHLERLQRSLDGIELANPLTPPAWAALVQEAIERSGGGDLSIYLQVTRGVQPRRDHAPPATPVPTVFLLTSALPATPAEVLTHGLAAITRPDPRWARCDIKSIALLPNVLLRGAASAANAAECLLLREGHLTEGAASNVFVVCEGRVLTPPADAHILHGVTRDALIALARSNGFALTEQPITQERLRRAEEIWVTSTTRGVLPVTRLDEQPVGAGVPGRHWHRLHDLWQAHIDDFRRDAAATPR